MLFSLFGDKPYARIKSAQCQKCHALLREMLYQSAPSVGLSYYLNHHLKYFLYQIAWRTSDSKSEMSSTLFDTLTDVKVTVVAVFRWINNICLHYLHCSACCPHLAMVTTFRQLYAMAFVR